MNQEVWCFLVSRNQYLDYRVVVAPDFMCEKNYTLILALAAGGEITDKGTAYYQAIIDSKVGDLTLVFRVIEALQTDIGISGDAFLKDGVKNRVILLIEGIVFKGKLSETDIVITSEDFDAVHKQIIENYQKFWSQTNAIPAYASTLLPLSEKENKDNAFQLIKLDDYIVGGKPKKEPKLETNQQLPKQEKSEDEFLGDRSQSLPPQQINQRELGGENTILDVIDYTVKVVPKIGFKLVEKFYEAVFEGAVQIEVDTPGGKRIITGEKDGNIRVKEDAGKIDITPTPKHDTEIRCMAVDNKKKILASGDKKGNVKIWELELGRASVTEKKTIRASQGPIQSLAFSPDGKTLTIIDDHGGSQTEMIS
ncbi:MAG: hypothetical protein QNJ68_06610 [Microcoleaceae cyanobacterium MO_207.B10]|nr:hypothetical protein [Microcoleaceae cyanobacterium MO_207.B10]